MVKRNAKQTSPKIAKAASAVLRDFVRVLERNR